MVEMGNRVFIYCLGCEKRLLDAAKMRDFFIKNRYTIVYNPKRADYIIFITCAFTKAVADSCIFEIKRFQRYDAELIVAGCLPAIESERLSHVFNGKTIVTKNIDDIDEIFPGGEIRFSDLNDANILFRNLDESKPRDRILSNVLSYLNVEYAVRRVKKSIVRKMLGERTFLYFLLSSDELFHMRVAWGCNNRCAYCGIRNAIGCFKSKPMVECLREFDSGLRRGYRNFVITGDEVGCYGIDMGANLPMLINEMLKRQGDYMISIRAVNPEWVIRYEEDLKHIMKSKRIFLFETPIQSKSHRILEMMHRYRDMDRLGEILQDLRNLSPRTIFLTDYILGFPTETEEEMRETLEFLVDTFDCGYVMPFSPRPGTEAKNFEPKLSPEEIKRRVRYAKRFFRKSGYRVFTPENYFFIFDRKR